MSQQATKEVENSPVTVPEQGLVSSPQSAHSDSTPVVFKDSFSLLGNDGKRASIAVPNYSREVLRLTDPIRRQSLIQFNTGPAEDTIRRESVATGKMPTMEARKRSIGERGPTEGGRRMSSPPPKRYVVLVRLSAFPSSIYNWPDYDKRSSKRDSWKKLLGL